MAETEKMQGIKFERSKTRKRVQERFPVLTFDRKTLRLLGVGERKWRGRKVPRDADTRSTLLSAYLGLVVKHEPFGSWASYLRDKFPDMRPDQGDAIKFCIDQLRESDLYDAWLLGRMPIEDALSVPDYAEYLERLQWDKLGDYHMIESNAILRRGPRVSLERRYLCSRCGLGSLANSLFATADYGRRIVHQMVWNPDLWSNFGQTELGVYSIPDDSTGHGRAGMRLETYEQVDAITRKLFLQQVGHCTPRTLAEELNDDELRVRKELEHARQVLGMRRRRGTQTRWENPEPCTECWTSMRSEALALAQDGISAMDIAGRILVGESIVWGWLRAVQ